MAAAIRLGDLSQGHGGWPARPNDEGSPNVFINGIPAHRQGDHWEIHCNMSCHDGTLESGSSTVFINGKQAGRVGDPITCGDIAATGSPNVFIG